jgi:hypothetical protein
VEEEGVGGVGFTFDTELDDTGDIGGDRGDFILTFFVVVIDVVV